ncbi:hypothetical protein PVK66_02260 [Aliivibrio sp. S4MY4]|uniref:FimV/HubP family polar landmark protein n=1 Tax=unclassified Aliivibrio TaxID=2645654 RepID=UPI0023790068|nr:MULTISPECIES: FimV/HubP family polar landmark protein [unclassified Aliivibrio]MDD9159020.1 hypothetical protein [Aliivibrio sp. S4TY1]MDD9162620.1 hypothetical protein [Aliivibrio sp. S4MY2]MDD9167019.1 hypothetical protein [Aliivibrio sp. S4MY4]MDD9183697.1 hypothetical protein [Aliivibrio sp. S4MY3]MDD9201326.1 hypothetical protein [Aliivibrio sp. S4MY1]
MSDASKKMFKTLTPLALFVASQCSVANAAGTIQIVGPEGKDQTVSSQVVTPSQSTRTATVSSQNLALEKQSATAPTKVYGPTREDETLWSIASRVNPSNTTSVQQTLLAIYRLNPHAFENNNIHGLEPNSRLSLPTLEQVRRENTDDAKQLLLAHSKKSVVKKAPEAKVENIAKVEKTEPKSTVAPIKTEKKIQEPKTVNNTVKSIEPVVESAPSVVALKSELETTEQEFTALQENNHQLRVRLAEVQHEVDNLKNELSDEDRIRNEVEKFINEQKQLAVAEKKAEPSAMDNLASSPGLIALLALIPGALIAGLIAFFLSRRKKEEEEEETAESTSDTPLPSALAMPEDNFNMDDDIPEISLDDDDDILGDLNDDEFLFGNDDSDSNDDLFAEFETEKTDSEDNDPFASLDEDEDDDLESMLSDDLDLDSLDDLDDDLDMSSSALTVDAEEKALGLEEMEKALNDFDSDLFSESDLETEDDDFDLSLIDDSDLSALDKSTPELEENEELEGGELEQSMLDDLFSSMDDDEEESELDQGWDLDEKEETKLVAEPSRDSLEDELDFDTLLSGIEDKPEENSESIDLDSDTEMFNELLDDSNDKDNNSLNIEDDLDLDVDEDSTALLDDLLDESDDEDDLDLDVDEDSTALLDDLLDESDDEDDLDLDVDEDSTALLDDLLDESDDEDDLDLEIDEDSTSLLDELLGEDDELTDEDDIEIDEDSTSLLDEYLSEGDDDDDIKIDEDSTALLDELIGDDSEEDDEALGKTGDDVDVEGVAASESLSEDTPRDEDWLVDAEEDEIDDIPLFESDLASESSLDLHEPEEELAPEAEVAESETTEAEEDVFANLEDDLEADEVTTLSPETEEADIEESTESELDEDTDFSFDLDESLEETELNELQAEEPIELEDDLLTEEVLTEEAPLVVETETEEDVFANLEDDLEADEVTTLSPETEEADIEESTESELDEDTDFSFDLDESLEATELNELQTEEPIELEDDLLAEEVLTEEAPLVVETETEEDVFANLEDDLEADEVTTLSPETEEADIEENTESELDEDTDFSFDLDESLEATELNELQAEEPIELKDDLLAEDAITENALEEETLAVNSASEIEDDLDENDFSLDDFLESSAVDFSQPNDDLDEEADEDHLEGLSIEDALAALEDDSDDITPPESEIEALEQDIDATEDDKSEESLTVEDEKEVAPFDFHSRVSDEEKEALTHLDSAGLDIDSMLDDGASDWSGFNLDNTPSMDSEVEDEDWAEQPNFANDPHGDDRFLSIEALIAETENGDKSSFEEEDLNLDVGLDDFPDMLGNVGSHDVDVNSDAQSKLDLARAYIEMSDDKGALELLEEVLRSDDAQLKVEAEKLMKQLG